MRARDGHRPGAPPAPTALPNRLFRGAPVTIRSGSLERLKLDGGVADGRVTVDAPRLVRLEMSRTRHLDPSKVKGARIAAPELSELIWRNAYHPSRDQIADARRHLRKLEVVPPDYYSLYYSSKFEVPKKMSALFKRFDYVDELSMHMDIPSCDTDEDEVRHDYSLLLGALL